MRKCTVPSAHSPLLYLFFLLGGTTEQEGQQASSSNGFGVFRFLFHPVPPGTGSKSAGLHIRIRNPCPTCRHEPPAPPLLGHPPAIPSTHPRLPPAGPFLLVCSLVIHTHLSLPGTDHPPCSLTHGQYLPQPYRHRRTSTLTAAHQPRPLPTSSPWWHLLCLQVSATCCL